MNCTRRAKGRTDTSLITAMAIWALLAFVIFWELTRAQSLAALPLLDHPLPFFPTSFLSLSSLFLALDLRVKILKERKNLYVPNMNLLPLNAPA